jgi:hypothetical protein
MLENVLATQKSSRLERERQVPRVDARAIVISNVYDEYKRMLDPRSWAHLPASLQILLLEPFWSWYNSTSDLDPATRADGIRQLPTIISKWRNDLRNKLASSVPIQPIFRDRPYVKPADRSPILSNLELATSVFTCHGCWVDDDSSGICLIGWEEIANHLSCPRMVRVGSDGLAASSVGHYTATAVMHLLDLDPKTVTAKELDKSDARFWCAKCPVARLRRISRRVIRHKMFTWRECVRFSINSYFSFNVPILFRLHMPSRTRESTAPRTAGSY